MASATLLGLFLTGNHASRPAANAVGSGSLYSCSTHSLIYQSDGSSWATWATLGTGGSGSITASGYTQNTSKLLGRTTASSGAIEEISVGSGLSLSGGSLSASGGGSSTFNTARVKYTGGDINVTGTTMAAIDTTNARLSLTTGASRVLIGVSGRFDYGNGGRVRFGIFLDGTEEGGTNGLYDGQVTGVSFNSRWLGFTYMTATLSAGSHTFDLSAARDAGATLIVNANSSVPLHMWAVEIPV